MESNTCELQPTGYVQGSCSTQIFGDDVVVLPNSASLPHFTCSSDTFPNSDPANTKVEIDGVVKKLNLNPTCFTLKDLIDSLHKMFSQDEVNIEEVHALMSAYKSNPAEWLKYAKFGRYRYTRNLVDAGNGKFNLMILCWPEGHGSSIHDHSNSHCFMKVLTGSLSELRYEWPGPNAVDQPLKEISRTDLLTDQVCYMNDSIGLHRVENLSYSECAVSLHLYCPPYDSCKVFDLRTGKDTVAHVTFWSIFGERKKNHAKKAKEQAAIEQPVINTSGTESEGY